jgi:nucleoid-associated protein EbfC
MPSADDETHGDEAAGDEDDVDVAQSHESGDDLSGLLAQLEAVSEELDEAVEEAADVIVQGSSAGGSVVIQLTGALEAVSVHIDPALVDPADVGMLEDALLAALRDGLSHVVEVQEQLAGELESPEIDLSGLLGKLGGLTSFGGLGLPDLGDLGNPEDLIAGLTGALGNLSGGLGSAFPSGLSDIMSGLGLGGAGPTIPGSDQDSSAAGDSPSPHADATDHAGAGDPTDNDPADTNAPAPERPRPGGGNADGASEA